MQYVLKLVQVGLKMCKTHFIKLLERNFACGEYLQHFCYNISICLAFMYLFKDI